jgi:hypothetical protein
VRSAVLVAVLAVLVHAASASAQEAEPTAEPAPMDRVPRLYSLTAGYAFTPKNDLPLSASDETFRPMGLAVEGRYGWQVSGLSGQRAPAWLGISTSFFAHTRGAPRSSLGVDYGLFVRHAVFPGPRVRGFFAYGLGASQNFVRGVGGRGIGHMTALSIGADIRLAGDLHATVEIAYRFIIVPSFETDLERAHRYDFHALRLVAGVLFGR